MKKLNLKDETIARLQSENACLFAALYDLSNGSVKWVHKGRSIQLGLCRITGASGGIVIHKVRDQVLGAYYFESWSADVIRTAETIQSQEWIDLRELVYDLKRIQNEALRAA